MAERSHSMPPQRSAVVVDAPSNLGLRPPSPDTIPGCWRLPQALRQAGIVTRLDATDGGRVLPPSYTPDRDATGTRNGLAIAGYSVKLADRLGEVLDAGGFPVLLGGDCSILLGAMLALCRRGRYGLAYLDGRGLDGFWIHVDVDVLDREVMPAVDSPEPDGLDYQELITLLRALTASGLAVGAEVAIFDPDLDPDGHLAQELVTAVVDGFGP